MRASIPSTIPSQHLTKTILFLAVAILGNSFGNLLLAMGMDRMPAFAAVSLPGYMLGLISNSYLLPGALLSAVYSLAQVSLFSWADLSFVVPCIASSYIVSTLLGEFVVGEHVAGMRWAGVVLIFIGVALVAETPVATRKHPHAQDPLQ